MKNNTPIFLAFLIIIILLISSSPVSADSIEVGKYKVEYDTLVVADTDMDGINDRTSYYQDEVLVFTAYDRDNNGKPDLWFRYDDELSLDLEIVDSDSDGEPDVFSHIDEEEAVTRIDGEGFGITSKLKPLVRYLVLLVVLVLFIKIIRRKKSNDQEEKKKYRYGPLRLLSSIIGVIGILIAKSVFIDLSPPSYTILGIEHTVFWNLMLFVGIISIFLNIIFWKRR